MDIRAVKPRVRPGPAFMSSSTAARARHYPLTPQVGDVVAGVSVASVLVPQALAYAELAGLPPIHGLYAATLPPIAAALAASSPYLQTGPVALTSLLTFGALTVIAPVESERYVALAALLALCVGVARAVFGLARLGWVAYLMSQPVVRGFTGASALLIIASQLPSALGAAAPDGGLLSRAAWAVWHPAGWEPAAVVLTLLTLALVLFGHRVHALFPSVLVAVVLGIAYSAAAGYSGPVVGPVRTGLPFVGGPLPWGSLPGLVLPGLVIALVGFAEPAAIARTYAMQDRRRWSPDREFVSQGLANLAAGLSAGFPVGGSFSRTSINRLAGGRTRWSGAVTGLVVLAFLPFAWVLAPLPRAVLGAIVIGAVVKLVAVRGLLKLWQVSVPQAAIGWTTFGLTLALAPRVDQAIIVGIGLAGVVHIWRELQVGVRTSYDQGVLTLEPQGVLFFGSAPGLEETLVNQVAEHPDAVRVVLDLEELGRIDFTGAMALKSVVQETVDAGLEMEVRHVPPHAARILSRVFGPEGLSGLTGLPFGPDG